MSVKFSHLNLKGKDLKHQTNTFSTYEVSILKEKWPFDLWNILNLSIFFKSEDIDKVFSFKSEGRIFSVLSDKSILEADSYKEFLQFYKKFKVINFTLISWKY